VSLIWFLVVVVLVAILVSIIWQLFGVGALFATLSPTQRTLFALLGLLIIIVVILYFFRNVITLPPMLGFLAWLAGF
jgi:hypothetical protein